MRMGHVDEDIIIDEVASFLKGKYDGEILQEVYVDGGRYADIVVSRKEKNLAVEVENDTDTYRNGVGQALHYERVGYIPVLAIPINRKDLLDPDTDSGEILNVCAGSNVALLGVDAHHDGDVKTGYLLRPF